MVWSPVALTKNGNFGRTWSYPQKPTKPLHPGKLTFLPWKSMVGSDVFLLWIHFWGIFVHFSGVYGNGSAKPSLYLERETGKERSQARDLPTAAFDAMSGGSYAHSFAKAIGSGQIIAPKTFLLRISPWKLADLAPYMGGAVVLCGLKKPCRGWGNFKMTHRVSFFFHLPPNMGGCHGPKTMARLSTSGGGPEERQVVKL